jgi:hypothetical protein
MRIAVKPVADVSWCMQTVEEGIEMPITVHSIILVRRWYKTLGYTWLATSRRNFGSGLYRVFTGHRLDMGDVEYCDSFAEAAIVLRCVAIEEYRRQPPDARTWAEWRADKEQNATLELLQY